MNYIKIKWIHPFLDEPVLTYSELSEQRWELRVVEVFPDGRMGYSDGEISTANTILGEKQIPALAEIAADPQFQPEEISKEEFEAVWAQAVGLKGNR